MHTHLPLHQIDTGVFVAPQLGPDAMGELARLGFAAVVCNRPDHEHGPDQPSAASVQAAAEAAGLAFAHLPVAGNHQTPEQVAAFAELLATLPRPLLAYCRSGGRSANLYALSQQAGR